MGKNLPIAEVRRTADVYNKHEGNMLRASQALKISRPALQTRIENIKRHHPNLIKQFAPAKGVDPRALTEEDMQKVREAFAATGTAKGVAAILKVSEEHASKLMRRAFGPNLDLQREKAASAVLRDKLKESERQRDLVQRELDKFMYASNAGFTPADWTLSGRRAKKGEHWPKLFVSDAQVGEVVDSKAIEYGRGYNTPIFRERYRSMIDTTIYLLTEHVGGDWKIPGFIYVRGGDAVSGGIHEELAQTDDMTPLEAVRIVFEEECAGIAKLADQFGRVDVKSVSGGNHDRDTKKPQSKKRVAHNLDALVDFMLANHFKGDKRVSFQLTQSPDVIYPVAGFNHLSTHGDNIGSRGGEGFIGPIATVARGVQKVIMEQMELGQKIDFVDMGHFHTLFFTRKFGVNGSFVGYSEFAKQNRMRPEPPQQTLTVWHAKHGMVDFKPIVLA